MATNTTFLLQCRYFSGAPKRIHLRLSGNSKEGRDQTFNTQTYVLIASSHFLEELEIGLIFIRILQSKLPRISAHSVFVNCFADYLETSGHNSPPKCLSSLLHLVY